MNRIENVIVYLPRKYKKKRIILTPFKDIGTYKIAVFWEISEDIRVGVKIIPLGIYIDQNTLVFRELNR